jgi:lysophospholipase L1-like esterase
LRWEGRLRFDADRNAIFDWASVRLHFVFDGTAFSLYGHLGRNYLDVLVDGRRVAVLGKGSKAPGLAWEGMGVRPQASGGTPAYRVQGLAAGPHQVVLAKRTGPQWAEITVLGLRLETDARLLDPPLAPARRLEFVGDSLTVGYGNEGPGLKCLDLPVYENSSEAWARLCSESLNADAQLIANSGHGLLRNYGSPGPRSADAMPSRYDGNLFSDSKGRWDRGRYQPDCAVVLIGENDHSTEPAPTADDFVSAFHAFLERMREGRPGLGVICAYVDDAGSNALRVSQVAKEELVMGKRVQPLALPPAKPEQMGCDWHPKLEVHRVWAGLAQAAIRKMMDW